MVGMTAASMASWCCLDMELKRGKMVPRTCLSFESDTVMGLYLKI